MAREHDHHFIYPFGLGEFALEVGAAALDLADSGLEVEEAGGIKAYQTLKAADKRLKAAGEFLAETRRMQAEALAKLQAAQTPPPPKKSRDELIQAIRFGTKQIDS